MSKPTMRDWNGVGERWHDGKHWYHTGPDGEPVREYNSAWEQNGPAAKVFLIALAAVFAGWVLYVVAWH